MVMFFLQEEKGELQQKSKMKTQFILPLLIEVKTGTFRSTRGYGQTQKYLLLKILLGVSNTNLDQCS